MNWGIFLAQMIVTLIVALTGWFVAHALSAQRDVANERRKLRINYLVEAFRKLEKASGRLETGLIESALADIQLLGSPLQIEMAFDIMKSFNNQKPDAEMFEKLLENLRESIRLELKMESADKKIHFFRFIEKN